jgi:hypothetical protein
VRLHGRQLKSTSELSEFVEHAFDAAPKAFRVQDVWSTFAVFQAFVKDKPDHPQNALRHRPERLVEAQPGREPADCCPYVSLLRTAAQAHWFRIRRICRLPFGDASLVEWPALSLLAEYQSLNNAIDFANASRILSTVWLTSLRR